MTFLILHLFCFFNNRKYILTCFFLISVLFSSVSIAGTAIDKGLEKLIIESDLVVYGRFVTLRSYWKGKKIFTSGQFEVEVPVKGIQSSSIEVNVLGGTAIHPRLKFPVTMKTSDGINLTKGESVILILRKASDSTYKISGMNRGKITVYEDPVSGIKHLQGMKKIHVSELKNSAGQTTVTSKPMTLMEFISYAETIVKKQASIK